jgi:ATP-dependent Lon protease
MEFTAESGVRNLERAIGAVCRTVAYEYAICKEPDNFKQVVITDATLDEALGNKRYSH